MFRFSMGGRGYEHGCGPSGRRGEFDPERFFHWVERLNAGERGRSGGRNRRMFERGELRLVLLKLIHDEPRHGYDLIKAIEELTGGAYVPSPGIVYPTLAMLTDVDHIAEQASDDNRKRFASTARGDDHLERHRDEVAALIARLTAIGEHRGRADRAPVRRAMGNLREAVRGRMVQGELSDDQLHDIAALLDEAAQKIERLK